MATTPAGRAFRRGLVLQGGGAKGAFQFGALQQLHEAGIKFDVIAGTSVGALNGAVVATGAWDLGERLWSDLAIGRAFRWTGFAAIYTALSLPSVLYLGWLSTVYDSFLPVWLRRTFQLTASLPLIVIAFALNFLPLGPLEHVLCGAFTLALATASYFAAGKQNFIRQDITWGWTFVWCLIAASTVFETVKHRGFVVMGSKLSGTELLLGLLLSASPLLFLVGFLHRWTNTALFSNSPLRETVGAIVQTGFRHPLLATAAEIVPEYVDPDDCEWTRLPRSTSWFAAPRSGFLPVYTRIDDLEPAAAVDALLASAALPLGIVPNSFFGAKRSRFVDGGVTDNTPWFPLIDALPCQEIVVVLCEPESTARDECALARKVWAKRDRTIRVMTEGHKIPNHQWKPWGDPFPISKSDPPVVVPLRNSASWPSKTDPIVIAPSKSLGNLLCGTMNFGRVRAQGNIKLGREAAALVTGRLSQSS